MYPFPKGYHVSITQDIFGYWKNDGAECVNNRKVVTWGSKINIMAIERLWTDKYEIVATSSVFTYKEEPLNLKYKFTNTNAAGAVEDNTFTLTIAFKTSPTEGNKIETEAGAGNHINLFIYNAIGQGGMSEPLSIARETRTDKQLFISVAFQQYGTSYLCSFTIFQER